MAGLRKRKSRRGCPGRLGGYLAKICPLSHPLAVRVGLSPALVDHVRLLPERLRLAGFCPRSEAPIPCGRLALATCRAVGASCSAEVRGARDKAISATRSAIIGHDFYRVNFFLDATCLRRLGFRCAARTGARVSTDKNVAYRIWPVVALSCHYVFPTGTTALIPFARICPYSPPLRKRQVPVNTALLCCISLAHIKPSDPAFHEGLNNVVWH